MARRFTTIETNLFPFLSVLVAVIGILMLELVSAMSAGLVPSGGPPKPEHPHSARKPKAPAIDEGQYRELEQRLEQLGAQLAVHRRTCRELDRVVRDLDALAQTKGAEEELGWTHPEHAYDGLVLRRPIEVLAVPDPTRTDRRQAVPVEVTADGYRIHRGGQAEELPSLPQDPKPMRQFLQEMDRLRGRSYLLLLVHPDGVAHYRILRALLVSEFGHEETIEGVNHRTSRIGVGVEPFDRDWLLLSPTPSR